LIKPNPAFKGVASTCRQGSTPAWPEAVKAPAGVQNIVLIPLERQLRRSVLHDAKCFFATSLPAKYSGDSSRVFSRFYSTHRYSVRPFAHCKGRTVELFVLHTKHDKPTVRISATTEMMVSQTDHVFIVCSTLMLKYSLTSQNPPSLTWEKMSDPAPVAMASSSGRTPAT